MKIAPIDITHKTFSRKMMGCDTEEVMDFLKNVADELEQLVSERNSLRESIREKELSIIEYRERDELLKNTITTATKMSDRIHTDAEREAKLIIEDATQQAEIITQGARNSLNSVYQEIAELKRIRMQFENNLRALFQSHITMLEQGQKIMPSPLIHDEAQGKIQGKPQEETLGTPQKALNSDSKTESELLEREVIKENVYRVIDEAAQKNLDADI